MPRLYEKESGTFLGEVSEEDIQSLVDQLEEEDRKDEDYFINVETVELLEGAGASAALVSLLRKAVGGSEGIDIRYEK